MFRTTRSESSGRSWNDHVGRGIVESVTDRRREFVVKAIFLSLALFVLLAVVHRSEPRIVRMRNNDNSEDLNLESLQFVDRPTWLLPVKAKNYHDRRNTHSLKNVSLDEILRHLQKLSDCRKTPWIRNARSDSSSSSGQTLLDTDNMEYLNSGWTKTVFSFKKRGGDSKSVAVKTLNPNGEDVWRCFNEKKSKLRDSSNRDSSHILPEWTGNGFKYEKKLVESVNSDGPSNSRDGLILEMCRNRAKLKLLKEAYLMSIIDNHHVVKLQDVCLSWGDGGDPQEDAKPAKEINWKDGWRELGIRPGGVGRAKKFILSKDDDVDDDDDGYGGDDRFANATLATLSGLTISYSTQLGTDADLISLLQLSWEDRLRICYGVAKLLGYLAGKGNATSPFSASVLINDFRRQQFVIVDGDVMMTDLDDLTFEGKSCTADFDCRIATDAESTTSSSSSSSSSPPPPPAVQCLRGTCRNWHQVRNAVDAASHFTSVLLPHGVPSSLKPLAAEILNGFSSIDWKADETISLMERLVGDFASGKYLARIRDVDAFAASEDADASQYKVLEGHDLPGYHDYRCRYTRGASGCTVSVHDAEEAKDLCDFDDACQAFVMSPVKSWTGRRYVHLKSNATQNALKKVQGNYTLYYKPHIFLASV